MEISSNGIKERSLLIESIQMYITWLLKLAPGCKNELNLTIAM